MDAYLPVKCKNRTLQCRVDPDIARQFGGRRLWRGGSGYVQVYEKPKVRHLHACIVKAAPGRHVDHINGDRLDCRRSNLRECWPWRNLHNLHKRSKARLGYYGVVETPGRKGRFRVQLQVAKKTRRCGSAWRSAVVASLVSDGLRRELVGGVGLTQNWPLTVPANAVGGLLWGCQGQAATIHYSQRATGELRSVRVTLAPKAFSTADYSRVLAIDVGGRRYRVTRRCRVTRPAAPLRAR